MAKFAAVSAFAGAAFAGDVALSWTDCGDSSTHGKISDVEPKTITLGTTTTVTGTGSVDEAVSAGSFSASITAGGGLVHDTWKGDLCSASTHSLPLGLGEIAFKGMSCPVAAGDASLALDVTLSASIPTSLASADIQLNGAAASGDKLICVKIHTQQAYNFESWKAEFGKVFNGDENEQRKAIWEAKDASIQDVNSRNLPYKLGHNAFSASTEEEMKQLLGFKQGAKWQVPHVGTHVEIEAPAASIDWTTKGVVNPVKNQGQCGSCWAFSTIGSIESRSAIATGSLPDLAEQQLVDCDKVDSGCSGGLMDNGFKYAEGAGLCTESSYPYTAQGGSCRASSCTVGLSRGSVTGYHDVSASTSALVSALNQGPVSVAVEADQMSFQMYSSGVLTSGCGTSLDHGVVAVGYGTENGVDYFKVRNSWGASWGSNGYLLIGRSGNVCGIHSQASYPAVSGAQVNV